MYQFKNDYSEGAYPSIVDKLISSNLEQTVGYGYDSYTQEAEQLIKNHINCDNADIYFLVGGTQTNLIAISAFLKPFEAVIAVDSGHICVHETGAIEATGHRIVSVPADNGKILPKDILKVLKTHKAGGAHMVKPKMVYISNATELGTIYTLSELKAISEVCKQNDLYFYVDGARLGSALSIENGDVTMKDMAELTDAFYIGGTKNGALFGEALVIINKDLQPDFKYMIKQRGGLLAKGRLLGIQFVELFSENDNGDILFYNIAKHMNKTAKKLQDGIKECGYDFFIQTNSNLVFPIFENNIYEKLREEFEFDVWEPIDDNTSATRLVTSWATKEDEVNRFLKLLKSLK